MNHTNKAIQDAVDGSKRNYMRKPQLWIQSGSKKEFWITYIKSKGEKFFVKIDDIDIAFDDHATSLATVDVIV